MARRPRIDRDQLLAEVALRLSKAGERAGDNPHALVREIFRGAGGRLDWRGEILGVQPRIRLTHSFDQRFRTYLGYALRVRGSVGGEARDLQGSSREAAWEPMT